MDVHRGMMEVKKLKRMGYSGEMIAIRIGEIVKKYERGKTLTIPEKLIIGLRYSEFLADDDTPLAYERAEVKRRNYLKEFNLTPREINELCRVLCDLK